MSDTTKKISTLLPNQIPDYVQDYYPLFVIFITKYFEYLENSSTGVQYTLQNIELNRDIDTTADNLAIQFLNTFVPNLPNNTEIDKTLLVKYFRQYYQLKGSEKSFRYFFRAFFNDEIEIDYPRNYLFKPSDGNWYEQKQLRVSSLSGDPANLKHVYVTGNTSGAYAIINDVVQVYGVGSTTYYDLVLQPASWRGTFVTSETITGIVHVHQSGTSVSTTSLITVTNSLGLISEPARYTDSRGQLSNDQLLQDSYYYQQFSYVIRTRTDRETWIDHVLEHLHPTGLILFNDYVEDKIASNATSSFSNIAQTARIETSVRIPSARDFYIVPTFTFDRIADLITGTSTTQIATSTGFTTVTYTSIGAISYSPTFDYPGEHVTWALQSLTDVFPTVTEVTRFGGPTFDKLLSTVGLDEQLIAWPLDVNTSIAITRYIAVSSNLTANTYLTSFTTQTLNYNGALSTATSIGSTILIANWAKNSQGNNAAGESSNAIEISISSDATVVLYFDNETQRNYEHIALNDSQPYNNLIYFHSSNSIQTDLVSGLPLSSNLYTGTVGKIIFKPYNWERGVTYDRLSMRMAIDQSQQLNTSLTETFSTADITASGLIASWSSLSTSVAVSSFTSTVTTANDFGRNAFVFNGDAVSDRFVQTTSFPRTQRIDLTLDYLVGDNYNGGENPDGAEDLVVQYSLDNGSTYTQFLKLWEGGSSNVWIYGTTSEAGTVFTQAGSTYLTGLSTLYLTDLNVGEILVISSSAATTAYTIVNIVNNNIAEISPALVDDILNVTSLAGTINAGIGGTTISGISTVFNTALVLGDFVTLDSSAATTAYVVTNVVDSSTITVSPSITADFVTSTLFKVRGIPYFQKVPTRNQWQTTSITVFGFVPHPTETSVIIRIKQLSQTDLNNDVYAISNMTVSNWRFQTTTGTVNIGVAVSSNSTLNISDTDFFTVTTIGT
jgi:hypothetical protein